MRVFDYEQAVASWEKFGEVISSPEVSRVLRARRCAMKAAWSSRRDRTVEGLILRALDSRAQPVSRQPARRFRDSHEGAREGRDANPRGTSVRRFK